MNFSTNNFLSLTSAYNKQNGSSAAKLGMNSSASGLEKTSLTSMLGNFKSGSGSNVSTQSSSIFGGIADSVFGSGITGMSGLTGGLGTRLSIDTGAGLSSLNFSKGLGTVSTKNMDVTSASLSDMSGLTGGLGTNAAKDLDINASTSSFFGKLGIGGLTSLNQLTDEEMAADTPSFMNIVRGKLA